MQEIIAGMRVIKMYCWEDPFGRIITNLRKYVFINLVINLIISRPHNPLSVDMNAWL